MMNNRNFTHKQLQYISNANGRWNFKVGATRSGKTYVDIRHIIPCQLRKMSGFSGLNCIIGITEGTVERNILAPMREIFGEDMVQKIDSRGICVLFNEKVHVIGGHRSFQTAKIRGASFKYAYGDEVTDWSHDFFEVMKSRLDKPYSRFDGTCNPEGPGHWLKKFLDNSDAYVQYFSIDDNPHLDDVFVRNLKKEYEGTMYYGRYIEGKWTAADGLVFPRFGAKCIVDRINLNYDRYVASVDYGIHNATAMLIFGFSAGQWTVISEFYHSGRKSGSPMTDEEYYMHLKSIVKQFTEKIECVIVDPSASSFIQLIRRKGEFAVKKAKNDIMNGIRNTASAMSLGKLKVYSGCTNLIEEISQYSWEKGEFNEKPAKTNDHACDALRYFVQTMKINN